MPHIAFKNVFKISRVSYSIHRGFKFQIKGIIPGGGLGKLQRLKEEEYFSRQDHKFLENLKDKIDSPPINYPKSSEPKHNSNEIKVCQRAHLIKHKNILEEAYFLNENCDCIQALKKQSGNKDKEDV